MAQPAFEDFSHELDEFLGELKEAAEKPSKIFDLQYLRKMAKTIEALDKVAKTLLDADDETVRYDAELIINMLERPIALADEPLLEISAVDAAKAFSSQEKEDSYLARLVQSCLSDHEKATKLIEDITDIDNDVKRP